MQRSIVTKGWNHTEFKQTRNRSGTLNTKLKSNRENREPFYDFVGQNTLLDKIFKKPTVKQVLIWRSYYCLENPSYDQRWSTLILSDNFNKLTIQSQVLVQWTIIWRQNDNFEISSRINYYLQFTLEEYIRQVESKTDSFHIIQQRIHSQLRT